MPDEKNTGRSFIEAVEEFFKYVNPGQEDKEWGLYLNCAGKAVIRPGVTYPPSSHPSGYYFTYEKGRRLDEYQVHYITEGEGIYENRAGRFRISPGSLLLTRPGDWHRFRPKKRTGWVEHYLGFSGEIAHSIFMHPWFKQKNAVVQVGYREEILDTYYKIFEILIEEKPGYQQISAGMVMKLLGFIVSADRQRNFNGKRVEKIIQNACFAMRENVETRIDFQSFAEESHIGYSYFRKMFKNYTGVSPLQYHLNLKVLRAKEMLLQTDQTVKEISYSLGFQSIYYFSRVFKNKLGIAPSELRRSIRL